MVTRINKRVASDGKEFDSADRAKWHEAAVDFVADIKPESASRQVYEAIVKAQARGWTLISPPRASGS